MKRGRGDQLTGGTGDVSPQLLSEILNMTVANTFVETTIPLPQNRFNLKKGRSIVVEVLKVYFTLPAKDNNHAAGGDISVAQAQIGTVTIGAYQPGNTRVFAFAEREYRGAFTALGSFQAVISDPYVLDLTDGSGHGILVATDNIFYGVTTTNYAAAQTFQMKMLYRFKEVSLEEYIGIVQSQQ